MGCSGSKDGTQPSQPVISVNYNNIRKPSVTRSQTKRSMRTKITRITTTKITKITTTKSTRIRRRTATATRIRTRRRRIATAIRISTRIELNHYWLRHFKDSKYLFKRLR